MLAKLLTKSQKTFPKLTPSTSASKKLKGPDQKDKRIATMVDPMK